MSDGICYRCGRASDNAGMCDACAWGMIDAMNAAEVERRIQEEGRRIQETQRREALNAASRFCA